MQEMYNHDSKIRLSYKIRVNYIYNKNLKYTCITLVEREVGGFFLSHLYAAGGDVAHNLTGPELLCY